MDLVIATGNNGKLEEFRDILSDKFGNMFSMRQIGITEEIDENGETLEENALIKARYVKARTPMAVLADDTGLCVRALGGLPGVHTARFAFDGATHAQNRRFLLEKMRGAADRSAVFKTVLALILPDGTIITAKGETAGKITETERGERGFGYDSVFFSDDLQKTFAEGSLEEKDAVSHRARAIRALLALLKEKSY